MKRCVQLDKLFKPIVANTQTLIRLKESVQLVLPRKDPLFEHVGHFREFRRVCKSKFGMDISSYFRFN